MSPLGTKTSSLCTTVQIKHSFGSFASRNVLPAILDVSGTINSIASALAPSNSETETTPPRLMNLRTEYNQAKSEQILMQAKVAQ